MATPDAFTFQTISTIGGAAIACSLVPNVLAKVIPIPDRGRAGVALILALVIQGGTYMSAAATYTFEGWLVAILNGFLVAAAALGINEKVSGNPPPVQERATRAATPSLRASWL